MEKLQAKKVINGDIKVERINGYNTFTIPSDRPFKILQLTDLHFSIGLIPRKANILAQNAIINVVEKSKPDLIIITGDLIFPIPFNNLSINNMKMAKKVAKLMETFEIPWSLVYGNHDIEPVSFSSKEALSKFYSSCDNCLFEKGDSKLSGMGNHIINLLNIKKEIVMPLVMLDSHMYTKNKGFFAYFSGFDNIHQDQIDWYKQEITKLSKGKSLLPSLSFFHIPPSEFKKAWKLHISELASDKEQVEYHFGEIGEVNGYFGVPKHQGTFFEEMVNFGSLKAFFCGHDHLSNASITYKGIRMTYGMSIDYLAYPHIKKWTSQRGGTEIFIDNNGNFKVHHIKLDELMEENTEKV